MAGNKALEKFKNSKIPKKGSGAVKDEVPIYQEPNTHSKIIGTIKKDEIFNWISKSICEGKEWVRCDVKNNFGYIIGNDMDGNTNLNMNSVQELKEVKIEISGINEIELTQEENELVNNAIKEIIEDDDEKKDENNESENVSKSTEFGNISSHSENLAKVEDELNQPFAYENDIIFKDDEVVFEPKDDYFDNLYFDPDVSNLDAIKKKFDCDLNNFKETLEKDKENEINYLNAIKDIFPNQKNLPVKDLLLESLDSIPGGKGEKKNKEKDILNEISKLNKLVDSEAKIMKKNKGSFRLTDGKKNGNNFSFKYYKSGWKGGSRAQIETYDAEKVGNNIRIVTKPLKIIFTALKIYDVANELMNAYNEDGNKIGTKTLVKLCEKAGEFLGNKLSDVLLTPIGGYFFGDYFSSFGGIIGKNIGKLLFE